MWFIMAVAVPSVPVGIEYTLLYPRVSVLARRTVLQVFPPNTLLWLFGRATLGAKRLRYFWPSIVHSSQRLLQYWARTSPRPGRSNSACQLATTVILNLWLFRIAGSVWMNSFRVSRWQITSLWPKSSFFACRSSSIFTRDSILILHTSAREPPSCKALDRYLYQS